MKRILGVAGLCLTSLLAITTPAMAGVVFALNTGSSSGTTFNYDFDFTTAMDMGTGLPTDRLEGSGPVQGFATLYDIGGAYTATLNDTTDFIFSTAGMGQTPPDAAPTDGSLPNVTISYKGGTLTSDMSFMNVLTIHEATSASSHLGMFAGQDTKNTGGAAGSEIGTVGFVTIPTGSSVPEPATFLVFGTVLLGLGLMRKGRV